MLDRKANVIDRLHENRREAADQFKVTAQGHQEFFGYAKSKIFPNCPHHLFHPEFQF